MGEALVQLGHGEGCLEEPRGPASGKTCGMNLHRY